MFEVRSLCKNNYRSMRTDFKIVKVLEYNDIFPDKEKVDIMAILKKYNREKLIRVVNVLSLSYGNAFMPDTTFFSEISKDKIGNLNKRFEKYAPKLQHQRICYCTQRTILELLRYVFSIPDNEYQDNGNNEDLEYDLFLVVIQLNENLMRFSGERDNKTLPIVMFFLRYVLNDVVGTNWDSTSRTQLIYFFKLKEFLELKENKSLLDALCKLWKMESLNDYFVTVFGLVALYVTEQQKNRKGCPCLAVENNKMLSKELCDYLSLDIKATYPYDSEESNDRDYNIDYRIFRSHPLIKDDKGNYYIYNLPLLCERLYNSLFFDLKSLYTGNFFQFYNSKFVEQYLFQQSMLECVGKKTTVYFPKKESIGEPERKDQPDFYIREKDSILLFECKGIKLNGMLKDKADLSEVIDELKNKLFLSVKSVDKKKQKKKEETVGVTQLVKQMNLVEDDKFVWDDDIPDKVSYYPVLVIEDPKIVQVGLTSIINEWYQPLLQKQLADTVSNPVVLMSIDILFLYKNVFEEKGFVKIFNDFFSGNKKCGNTGVDWRLDPLADFNSYMTSTYKPCKSSLDFFNQKITEVTSNKTEVCNNMNG